MTGEMSQSDVTREAFPIHFAIADSLNGKVCPFDVYRGPYITARGHKLWLIDDDGFAAVYDETTNRQSYSAPPDLTGYFVDAANYLIDGGGFDPSAAEMQHDADWNASIGEM